MVVVEADSVHLGLDFFRERGPNDHDGIGFFNCARGNGNIRRGVCGQGILSTTCAVANNFPGVVLGGEEVLDMV